MTFRFYRSPLIVRDGLAWAGPKNNEHMPFPGHRTQQEVREENARATEHRATRRKIRAA